MLCRNFRASEEMSAFRERNLRWSETDKCVASFFNTNANTPVLRRAPRSLGYALIGQLTQKLFHRQMCSKPTPYFFFLPVILVLVDLERYFYIISAGKRSGVDSKCAILGIWKLFL